MFVSGREEVGFSLGAGPGYAILGSQVAHDMAFATLRYGKVMTDVLEEGSWRAGNLEFIAEVFAGGQWYPDNDYIVGAIPLLRYNFTTGSRVVPFFDAGAGVTLTDIGEPDLGGIFQFNLQAGIGTHIFLNQNTALTLQCRFIHLSNAGLRIPNGGADATVFSAGVSWFF